MAVENHNSPECDYGTSDTGIISLTPSALSGSIIPALLNKTFKSGYSSINCLATAFMPVPPPVVELIEYHQQLKSFAKLV
ncbi:hypothetical protein AB6A23_26585 [Paenibacillus tarimensis]